MKNGKFSIAVLCMGLAGCSLPFFSQPQKDTASLEKEESVFAEFADEMKQQAVAQEGATNEVVSEAKADLSENELAAVKVQKEKDQERIRTNEEVQERAIADLPDEKPTFTKLVKTIQANLFDEEGGVATEDLIEEPTGRPEMADPGILELDQNFVKKVEFIEPDIIPEGLDTVSEKSLIGEIAATEALEMDDEASQKITKDIPEDIARTLESSPEIPAVEIPEEIIPAGALPSTGAPGPLATLWGWVKSWF